MLHLIIIPIVVIVVVFPILYSTNFSHSRAIEEGKRLINQGKTQNALEVFKKLVDRKPDEPYAHFYLAEAYYKNKDYEWALTEFKKTESYTRDKYKLFDEKIMYERLGELYLRYDQTEEAQKALLSVLETSPGDYLAHIKIGETFFKRGLLDNALSYYQKALSIKDNGAEALFGCGEVFYHKKSFTQALGYLKGAVKYRPALVKANYYMGMIYKGTENFAKAVTELDIASQSKKMRTRALFNKGICLVRLNEVQQAVNSYERAIKSVKDDEELEENSALVILIRYSLAEAYEDERQIIKALDQWEKIQEQNPKYKDVPEKLRMYSDLRVDDNLKDFLTATEKEFKEICEKILETKNQTVVDKSQMKCKEHFEAVVEESDGERQRSRTNKKLVMVYRENNPIGEDLLRSILEKMKGLSVPEAMIYSSSNFTIKAKQFAETRPLDLLDRKSLSETLNTIKWD